MNNRDTEMKDYINRLQDNGIIMVGATESISYLDTINYLFIDTRNSGKLIYVSVDNEPKIHIQAHRFNRYDILPTKGSKRATVYSFDEMYQKILEICNNKDFTSLEEVVESLEKDINLILHSAKPNINNDGVNYLFLSEQFNETVVQVVTNREKVYKVFCINNDTQIGDRVFKDTTKNFNELYDIILGCFDVDRI